jgi:hypothetical protein
MNDSTKKLYTNSLTRIIQILDTSNLPESLKKAKIVINAINNTELSQATKLLFVRTILFCNKFYPRIMTTAQYKIFDTYFKENSISSDDNRVKDINTNIISFKDYIKNVKNTFGSDSMSYLVTMMYYHYTVRDDFHLFLTDDIKSTTNPNTNYLFVKKHSPENTSSGFIVILNHYKTSAKYGRQMKALPLSVNKLLTNYIQKHDIKIGDYLFGKLKSLTNFVSKMNHEMNLSENTRGAISYFRHARITELLSNKNVTPTQRLKLADTMLHHPSTQLLYNRKFL